VSEKDAQAYYDTHAAEFTVAAQATVHEIVLKARPSDPAGRRAEAEAVRERAAADGADFEAIAKEVSEAGTKASGGLLGAGREGDLGPALDEAAFRLPVGVVGPVIEDEHGFHVLKVDARTDEHLQPFDAVREDIEKTLRDNQIEKETRAYLKKAWGEATIW